MNIETLFAIIVFSGIISVMLMSARSGPTEDLYNKQNTCRHDWSVFPPTGKLQCCKCNFNAGS